MLQVKEMQVVATNTDNVSHRLHNRLLLGGKIDIAPGAEVLLPAVVFKRNCHKDWLWRKGAEPATQAALAEFTMAELRAEAKKQGKKIKFGATKEEAVQTVKEGNDE